MQNGLFFAVSADSFCDTVLVVSNCIMGLFGSAIFFYQLRRCIWETGTTFVPHCTVQLNPDRASWATSAKIAEKKFIFQMKTSLQRSCDRCDPVCDNFGRENSFFKGCFPHDRYDSSVCWTIFSDLGEQWTLDVHYTTILLLA